MKKLHFLKYFVLTGFASFLISCAALQIQYSQSSAQLAYQAAMTCATDAQFQAAKEAYGDACRGSGSDSVARKNARNAALSAGATNDGAEAVVQAVVAQCWANFAKTLE